MNYELVTHV